MPENFRIEFDNQTQKSVIIFFLIFGIFILFIAIREYYFGYDLRKEELLHKEYNKKVDSIYVNKNEHNFTYVVYSDGKEEILDFNYLKNDSLSKKRGDSIEYIYRNNGILKNNLLESLRFYMNKD